MNSRLNRHHFVFDDAPDESFHFLVSVCCDLVTFVEKKESVKCCYFHITIYTVTRKNTMQYHDIGRSLYRLSQIVTIATSLDVQKIGVNS